MAYPSGTPLPGVRYEIVIHGHLGGALRRSFEELDVVCGPASTRLSGWFADQAALFGVLRQLWDMGFELCSIRQLGSSP